MRSSSRLHLLSAVMALLVSASSSLGQAQDTGDGSATVGIPTLAYVSCMTATCENTTVAAVNAADCTVFNLTGLGQCVQPFGSSFGAPYVRVYCQQSTGLAYSAAFGQDAACSPSSLQQVVVQRAGLCAQSNWISCGEEDVPPPPYVSQPDAYVAEVNSDQADCSGASSTIAFLLTEHCSSNYNGRNSVYHACSRNGSAFVESRYTNVTDYTCAVSAQQALLTRDVSAGCVAQTEAAYLGPYHRWTCGNTYANPLGGGSASSAATPVPSVGLVSCNTATCVNTSASAINLDDCVFADLADSLGQCSQPYGPGFGYVAVFCQQESGLAYSATFGKDPTCALANLEQVLVQRADRCAQSNWISCGSVDRPPPAILLDPARVAYVAEVNSDQADCGGASSTIAFLLTEHCSSNYNGRNSVYHACSRNGSAFVESRYTNVTDYTCAVSAQQALLTRDVSAGCVAQTEAAYLGPYHRYACGDTGLALVQGTATNPITNPPLQASNNGGGTAGGASAGAGVDGTSTGGGGGGGATAATGSGGGGGDSGAAGTTSTSGGDAGAGSTSTGAAAGGGSSDPLPDITASASELRAGLSALILLAALSTIATSL